MPDATPPSGPHAAAIQPARGPGNTSPAPARPLLLVLATAKEYRAALSGLGAPAPPAPGATVRWRRGGRDHAVLVSGVGPVAAALAVGRAIGAASQAFGGVVGLGIAGSFDLTALPLGGLVAATAELFPEYGLRGPESVDARGIAFPQATIDGQDIYDRLDLRPPAEAARAMGLTLPGETVAGTCLTVAGVTATADRAAFLAGRHAALAESMEGFAVALGAAASGLPVLILRVISNRVGSRPPVDWDLPGAFAALGRTAARLFS
jgi:futalosine hydrolase